MCGKNQNTDPNSPQLFECNHVYIYLGSVEGELSSEELLDMLEPVPSEDNRPAPPDLSDKEKSEMVSVIQQVSTVLFEHDPMCLNFGINTDEYDPEACSLVAKLNYGITKCEVANAVAEVISYYFSQDFSMYTHYKKWKTMAQQIWAAWTAYQEKSPSDDK